MKKERVYRVLGIKKETTFNELVKDSEVSKSYVSMIIKKLKENNLVLTNNKIKIIDLIEFIRFWGMEKRNILKRANFFLTDTLFFEDFLSTLSNKDYVLSGQFVENLITKQSPGNSLWVYIFDENTFLELMGEFKKKRTGRIKIILYDEHIKYGSFVLQGYRVVSLEQLCADLIAEGIFTDIKTILDAVPFETR